MMENRRVSRLLKRLDHELTRRADVVFATSRSQCDRRRSVNPRTYLVPNGVDFDSFNRALTEELPVPEDIAGMPRPIFGFVGWLTHHIDVALLRRIAEAYPHCSLVLVGPDELRACPDLDALRSRSNVVFLGRKDHSTVPAYLRVFDVALMPYSLTGHVLSAYPAKLHEYLAAGRAIVATDLPELRPYENVVWLATSHDDFVQMIGQALADCSMEAINARLAVARDNTWDQRVADIGSILSPLLRPQ
jgi:glycosyltransferase involved in cell wall biosynthesis